MGGLGCCHGRHTGNHTGSKPGWRCSMSPHCKSPVHKLQEVRNPGLTHRSGSRGGRAARAVRRAPGQTQSSRYEGGHQQHGMNQSGQQPLARGRASGQPAGQGEACHLPPASPLPLTLLPQLGGSSGARMPPLSVMSTRLSASSGGSRFTASSTAATAASASGFSAGRGCS